MQTLEALNPIATAIYFVAVSGIAMLCTDPLLLFISLCGALLLFFLRNGARGMRTHAAYLLLFAVTALINPLVSHNGVTVLFVLNNSPITLEALLYGVTASAMIIAVLYWFRSFSQIMSSDKLLYIFGKLSPKLSLVLSMGLRYVPLFVAQMRRVSEAQTALGLYKDGNIIDKTRGRLRVFSVTVTWALENGIVTADSMTARGYGLSGRTHFSLFGFHRRDVLFIIAVLALFTVTCICAATGAIGFEFYPSLIPAEQTPFSAAGYISYGILAILPSAIEVKEKIKWKYLKSKI